MRRGEIKERADVNYASGSIIISKVYERPKFKLTPLGELATFVQYGSSSPATEEPVGLPMIRMNNLQDDGWDFSDLKYIELPQNEAEKYRLEIGDILFNRTNSKELVGKCEVFREQGHWVFASYLIRVRLDTIKALPDFVSTFLNTRAGRAQIDRVSRQIVGMSNVNAEELRALLIPLPHLNIQQRLIKELDAARESRLRKLSQANELLENLDSYLLDTLGLTSPSENTEQVFAVRLKQLRGKRIDALAHRPFYARGESPDIPTKLLREVADIDKNSVQKPTDENFLVPYIGLPECNLTSVREVAMRPYKEVKGRSIVKPGDILFARIEPSVFNKKYVLADDLKGHEYAYTSTEFYVVTAKETEINRDYLYAMFFCSFVFAQVKGKTTGSSGRRRIDSSLFAELQIPLPSMAVQNLVAEEVRRRREGVRQSREEASQEWISAKQQFEQFLLSKDI